MLFGRSRRERELQESFDRLEAKFRALQVEWEDVYSKVVRALQRIAKSRARMEELERQEEEAGKAPGLSSPQLAAAPGFLTPRQKELQQQILRRRAGG